MKKRITGIALATAVLAVTLGMAATAQATPDKSNPCSACHDVAAQVVVTATQTSNNGTTATYNVSVNNAYGDGVSGWAVFGAAGKLASAYGAGTFQVPVGATYTVHGVAGSGGIGSNSVTISPVAPPPADTTAPTVGITSPATNTTVSGLVGIAATASDTGSGVARVDFTVDGTPVGSDAAAPYSATWDASLAASGSHTILAKAYDVAGNSSSAAVTVSIASPPPSDTTSPTVTITSPVNGAVVPSSGTVAVSANATDTSGIAKVEFRIDGVLKATDVAAPYSFGWTTTSVPSGTHTITATAVDAAGNRATATSKVTVPIRTSTLTVTVKNTSKKAIAGATVVVKNLKTGAKVTKTTNTSGYARFYKVKYGSYSVTISKRGYKTRTYKITVGTPTKSLPAVLYRA